jgi:hypothetical protein
MFSTTVVLNVCQARNDSGSLSSIFTGSVTPSPFHVPIELRAEIRKALEPLTNQSRLYLRGHGIWEAMTLGGWHAREVAGLLVMGKLKAVKLISVTGCNAARASAYGDEATPNPTPSMKDTVRDARAVLLGNSLNSFAGRLHFRLKQPHGIVCDLYGRTYYVNVLAEKALTNQLGFLYTKLGRGHKATAPGLEIQSSGGERHKRAFSKIRFYWNGNQQMSEWVSYDT